MTHHTPHISPAEAAGSVSAFAPDQEALNMRSLAMQLRRNGHQYRQWSREAAAKGQVVAAETFENRAARYSQDAIWYWKRSRL